MRCEHPKKIAARWWAERRGGDGKETWWLVDPSPVETCCRGRSGETKLANSGCRTKAFGPWWSWAEHRKPGSRARASLPVGSRPRPCGALRTQGRGCRPLTALPCCAVSSWRSPPHATGESIRPRRAWLLSNLRTRAVVLGVLPQTWPGPVPSGPGRSLALVPGLSLSKSCAGRFRLELKQEPRSLSPSVSGLLQAFLTPFLWPPASPPALPAC